MKNALKVLSWVNIAIGGLALIGWLNDGDGEIYGFIAAALFVATGVVALKYIAENATR
jgi:hypothetical protein